MGKHKLHLMIGNLFFLCSGISSLELITLENEYIFHPIILKHIMSQKCVGTNHR